jgi:hypothetical protein
VGATPDSPPTDASEQTEVPPEPEQARPSARLQRLKGAGKPAAGVLTIVIALWGAFTGTLAWLQNREISVDVSAETNTAFYSLGQYGIGTDQLRVAVINSSSRGVTLSSGEVLYRDVIAGQIIGVSADSGQTPATPSALPYTVAANTSARLVLDWRVGLAAQPALEAALPIPAAARRMSVRLHFEPGGVRTVALLTGQAPPVINGWLTFLTLAGNRVTGLAIESAARTGAPAIATLKLWDLASQASGPVVTSRRPVGWQVPARFDLSSLAPATYAFAFSADQATVVTGVLHTKCTGQSGTYLANVCADGLANEAKPFATPTPTPTPTG